MAWNKISFTLIDEYQRNRKKAKLNLSYRYSQILLLSFSKISAIYLPDEVDEFFDDTFKVEILPVLNIASLLCKMNIKQIPQIIKTKLF